MSGAITNTQEKQDAYFRDKKTEGEIYESIVKNLLESTGEWECVKFGMENHIEELRKKIKGNYSGPTNKIRNMPDFVAINKKTSEVILLEVKFRGYIDSSDPTKKLFKFQYGQMGSYLDNWHGVKLVIVSAEEPYFYYIDTAWIKKDKHFDSFSSNGGTRPYELWNLKDICLDLRKLYPSIKKDSFDTAVRRIKIAAA